tara:strand:- start:2560 stop:2955 length:396 start_codon:yes stop_codon:yes gene_type:complete
VPEPALQQEAMSLRVQLQDQPPEADQLLRDLTLDRPHEQLETIQPQDRLLRDLPLGHLDLQLRDQHDLLHVQIHLLEHEQDLAAAVLERVEVVVPEEEIIRHKTSVLKAESSTDRDFGKHAESLKPITKIT